jgi:hypothetical protein
VTGGKEKKDMALTDDEGNVTPTGPVGPMGLRWTYLRPYGAGDRYMADLYRSDGLDSLHFVKVGKAAARETGEGTLDLDFTKDELDGMIAELIWLRENWGKVGRGVE